MRRLSALAVLVSIGLITLAAQSRKPAGTDHTGNAFRFNKVRDGVYHAVGTGSLAAESDATTQAQLERQIKVAENNLASQRELKPTPPNVTLKDRMTLYRGSREIQIRYLGRGHTAGDVVVFLPNEKVVLTGDFLTAGMSNLSDSFPDEWVASLDELKKLDFDTVLPGHGEAF